jgi:hypothetical protein
MTVNALVSLYVLLQRLLIAELLPLVQTTTYLSDVLLGCDAVLCGRILPTFLLSLHLQVILKMEAADPS